MVRSNAREGSQDSLARHTPAGRHRRGSRRDDESADRRRPALETAGPDGGEREVTDASAAVYEEFVRRLAAATRGIALYSPEHPIVLRGMDAVAALCRAGLQKADSLVLGIIGDE